MDLKDIPEVGGITGDGDYAYFVLRTYGDGQRMIVRCWPHGSPEPDPYDEPGIDPARVSFAILGGGVLSVSTDRTGIVVGGSSRTHGREPDREATANMLRRAFPDRIVEIL